VAWMFVYCECCVSSGRGLCAGLITRPEESYRVSCVVVCDLDTSWMRRSWSTGGCRAKNKQTNHEDPHYAFFRSLVTFSLLKQPISFVACSQIPSAYVYPVMWESTVHTLIQTQAELYAPQSCVFYCLYLQLADRKTA